jgi:hypothetical protein
MKYVPAGNVHVAVPVPVVAASVPVPHCVGELDEFVAW